MDLAICIFLSQFIVKNFFDLVTDELADKVEYCEKLLRTDEADNDYDDSDMGIDHEEDNLIGSIYDCELQLFRRSYFRDPIEFCRKSSSNTKSEHMGRLEIGYFLFFNIHVALP